MRLLEVLLPIKTPLGFIQPRGDQGEPTILSWELFAFIFARSCAIDMPELPRAKLVMFVSGLPPLSSYVVAVDERSDEPIVCRIMLNAAEEVAISEVSSTSSLELESELNVLTAASVTAAPKPVTVCL